MKTVKFEFDPNNSQDFIIKLREAWNSNPGTKIETTSHGLTGNPDGKSFIELALIPA